MKVEPHDGALKFVKAFSDPEAVANYADGPRRFVPGMEALHRMTGLLLAERAPQDGRILVLGAGGGLELKAMADAHPGWTFVGVDPARAMLDLAANAVAPHGDRVTLVEGYIDDAPEGPFHGATCLLTLHFLDEPSRLDTLRAIRWRLRPGAPLVVAHASFPQEPRAERSDWLARYASFAVSSGADPDKVEKARTAVDASLNMLPPERDEASLRDAGFTDVRLFYAAFTWRGWVSYA